MRRSNTVEHTGTEDKEEAKPWLGVRRGGVGKLDVGFNEGKLCEGIAKEREACESRTQWCGKPAHGVCRGDSCHVVKDVAHVTCDTTMKPVRVGRCATRTVARSSVVRDSNTWSSISHDRTLPHCTSHGATSTPLLHAPSPRRASSPALPLSGVRSASKPPTYSSSSLTSKSEWK